ncbi:hypothetical protein K439DRAFT_1364807 [Ramaria rubella]|nr:hypothetical protein K439DRAFT_1364807 [Ramaria rubella]
MQHTAPFPPPLPTKEEMEKIAFSFCEATKDVQIEEIGCAVCGMLVHKIKALDLVASAVDLNLLTCPRSQATRQERKLPTDQISDKPGPIIDPNCSHICQDCHELLKKRKIPLLSLANGNWIANEVDSTGVLALVHRQEDNVVHVTFPLAEVFKDKVGDTVIGDIGFL